MCRILAYLGEPIIAEELLYKTDNSFVKQSYNPKYMSHLLNLAGFGLVAWDKGSLHSQMPNVYKTTALPFYDENLRNLAAKINPSCLLTHIRGVSYETHQVISDQNVHPFIFRSSTVAMAHNGSLFDFADMKYDLLPFINPEYQKCIKGTTDSEWIYAIFMSQMPYPAGSFKSEEVINAILETLKIIQEVRMKHKIQINSPVNLFITNGEFVAATRFVYDYGWWQPNDAHNLAHFTYHSLWYTFGERYGFYDDEYKMKGGGKRSSLIIASEPLTQDTTTWVEVPENTLLYAERDNQNVKIISQDIII
jgi:glutamine amidotransferase